MLEVISLSLFKSNKNNFFSRKLGYFCELQEERQIFDLKFKKQSNILLDTKYFLTQDNVILGKLTFIGIEGVSLIVSNSGQKMHKIIDVASGMEVGKTTSGSFLFGKQSWILNVTLNEEDHPEILLLNMKFTNVSHIYQMGE